MTKKNKFKKFAKRKSYYETWVQLMRAKEAKERVCLCGMGARI